MKTLMAYRAVCGLCRCTYEIDPPVTWGQTDIVCTESGCAGRLLVLVK